MHTNTTTCWHKQLLLFFAVLLFTNTGVADVPPEQKMEINHLVDFVRNSACLMERNGAKHSATEAASHILKRYDYFRDEINNTEDFIQMTASRSTITGKDYQVLCPNLEPMRAQDWLLAELNKFRTVQSNTASVTLN
ncbi:DUF5329 family protein [Zooshikella marina]|uniref:DUF5329 domain-containing protein n=1 Tax=Zooshikella ganghwensis TaxID=202772 RepID=A0A4P9VQP7_9GAMM|nr:DUF5329 family protein [Zooshikella ganghwensis]MBU2704923.1 DUF5329 family protein [Zooshikella ganghwensis]RDH45356.1 hypothetical protein B9G39_18935 [Zooshikella ganghwensis]